MPTKDPDTKGRTGNQTHDYIVSVTTTSRLASEEYAYTPNQAAADSLQVLEANRRRFYRAHLPSFPRKRESTPGPIATPKTTGVLDSGLRRNDGGGIYAPIDSRRLTGSGCWPGVDSRFRGNDDRWAQE